MLILYKIKILVIKKNILEGNSNHPLLCYHIVKSLWTVDNVKITNSNHVTSIFTLMGIVILYLIVDTIVFKLFMY